MTLHDPVLDVLSQSDGGVHLTCGWSVSLHTFFSDCLSSIEPLTGLDKHKMVVVLSWARFTCPITKLGAGYKLRNTCSQYLNWLTGCCHVVAKTFGGKTVLRSLFALTHACIAVWFVCRDDMVDLVGSYQFDDQATQGGDVFARDPYILRFRCMNTGRRHIHFSPHPNQESCYSAVNHNVCLGDHHSAEGPGDDPSPHKTR